MANNEIQVLIKAVDSVSQTMGRIEKNLANSNKAITESNKKVGLSFESSASKLIAMGNIASSVDNIFSALTNQQLRLENATLRLINSQESLADVQRDSSRAGRDLKRAQEELEEAEKNRFKDFNRYERAVLDLERAEDRVTDTQIAEERAVRNLTISQNNLKRQQDAVLGTYLQLGVQSLTLATSVFPILTQSIQALGVSMQIARTAATGLVIGGLIFLIEKAIEAGRPENYEGIQTQLHGVINTLGLIEIKASRVFQVIQNILDQEAKLRKFQRSTGVNTGTIMSGGPSVNIPERIVYGQNGPFVIGGSVGDGIIKPDGTIIKTDPRDTLVAMKDVSSSIGGMSDGGVTINIHGDNYGINADQIAKALWDKIRHKISI